MAFCRSIAAEAAQSKIAVQHAIVRMIDRVLLLQEAEGSPDAMAASTSDQGEKPLGAVIAAAEALAAHQQPIAGMQSPLIVYDSAVL